MSDYRETTICGFIATTGTGKSTKCREKAKKIGGKQLIIVDTEDVEGWEGIKVINPTKKELSFKAGRRKIYADNIKDKKVMWAAIYNWFGNGILILDDARDYVEANNELNGKLPSIFRRHRHIRIDILFVIHGFDEMPPKLWKYVKYLYIGYLTAIPEPKEVGKLRNKRELIKLCEDINLKLDQHQSEGGDIRGMFFCRKS